MLRTMARYATVDDCLAAIPEPLRSVSAQTRQVIDSNLDGAE
jgi:hypothetical protein